MALGLVCKDEPLLVCQKVGCQREGGRGVAYVANITYSHDNIPELLMAAGFMVDFYRALHISLDATPPSTRLHRV